MTTLSFVILSFSEPLYEFYIPGALRGDYSLCSFVHLRGLHLTVNFTTWPTVHSHGQKVVCIRANWLIKLGPIVVLVA